MMFVALLISAFLTVMTNGQSALQVSCDQRRRSEEELSGCLTDARLSELSGDAPSYERCKAMSVALRRMEGLCEQGGGSGTGNSSSSSTGGNPICVFGCCWSSAEGRFRC